MRLDSPPVPAATARTVVTLALVVATGALGGWVAACGLPLTGLGPNDLEGGTGADVTTGADGTSAEGSSGGGDDGPTACTTVDAACLGGIPSGWQPVTVADAGCPSAFTAAVLRVNPRLDKGSCACGACQVVGALQCTNGVAISGGDGCNDSTLVTALPDTCTQAQAQHVEAHPVGPGGVVGCFAANDAGSGATTDPLTVCYPGCTADFCGSGPRCIVSDGDVVCPSGFTLLAKAGTGADPGCAPCGCDAGPAAACGGSVTVFNDDHCGDGGSATYAIGTCNQFTTSGDYNSLLVHLDPPDAACTVASTLLAGDASLVGVRTICCQ